MERKKKKTERNGSALCRWILYTDRQPDRKTDIKKEQKTKKATICKLNPKNGPPDPKNHGKESKQHWNQAKFDKVTKQILL